MNTRMLSIFTTITCAALVASLGEYLKNLYCGCWFSSVVWLISCVAYCYSLWVLEQQRQLWRALDEVDRVKRRYLAFMLQLPGQIYFTLEKRTSYEEV